MPPLPPTAIQKVKGTVCNRNIKIKQFNQFHIKGTWSVHTFNGDYLSIPSAHWYLAEVPEIPSNKTVKTILNSS